MAFVVFNRIRTKPQARGESFPYEQLKCFLKETGILSRELNLVLASFCFSSVAHRQDLNLVLNSSDYGFISLVYIF